LTINNYSTNILLSFSTNLIENTFYDMQLSKNKLIGYSADD